MNKPKIGDLVFFYPRNGYGNHGATIKVTRVLRATFEGIEEERSYRPGKKWRVHNTFEYAITSYKDGLLCRKWINS